MSREVKVLRIKLPPDQTSCKFFRLRGRCARGTSCRFRHDVQEVRQKSQCIFFNNGFCKYGGECRFVYVGSDTTPPGSATAQPAQSPEHSPLRTQSQTMGFINRRICGAQVKLGLGAEVLSLELPESLEIVSGLNSNFIACVWKREGPHALLYFENPRAAFQAKDILQQAFKIKGELYNPDDGSDDGDMDFGSAIRLSDIPRGIGELDLRRAIENVADAPFIEDIVMHNAKVSSQVQLGAIKHFFHREGEIAYYKDNFSSNKESIRMTIEYKDADDMRSAIRKYHHKYIPALRKKLYVYQMITIRQTIRASIFKVLATEYKELCSLLKTRYNVLCREYEAEHGLGLVHIKLMGYDKMTLATSKKIFHNLFAGTVAQDESKVLWHSFLAKQIGLQFLKSVMRDSGAYVFCDRTNSNLILFGSSEAKSEALALLISKIEELHDYRLTEVIRSTEYETMDFNQMFEYLLGKLGPESVTMQRVSEDKFRLRFRALPLQMTETKLYLSKFTQRKQPDAETSALCSICWSKPDDSLTLPCDHFYCRECFINQCEASSDSQFPVKCYARSTAHGINDAANLCNLALPLYFLQSTLPASVFEDLLRRAVSAYVKTSPQSLKYCSTADCHHLYAPIDPLPNTVAMPYKPTSDCPTDPTIFTCPDCFQTACRRCHAPAHPWLDCEEAVDMQGGGEQAFKRWKTSNLNVKDCPSCKSTIEKIDGCNHMHCAQCKTHICWFCLAFFDDPDSCYTHMEEQHRGNGLEEGSDEESEDGSEDDEDNRLYEDEDEEDFNERMLNMAVETRGFVDVPLDDI